MIRKLTGAALALSLLALLSAAEGCKQQRQPGGIEPRRPYSAPSPVPSGGGWVLLSAYASVHPYSVDWSIRDNLGRQVAGDDNVPVAGRNVWQADYQYAAAQLPLLIRMTVKASTGGGNGYCHIVSTKHAEARGAASAELEGGQSVSCELTER